MSEKDFPLGNLRTHTDTNLRSPAKKEAVSYNCSEKDDKRFRFCLVAREPKLMYGAKGRASSQRSTDYHVLPRLNQSRIRAESRRKAPWPVKIAPGTLSTSIWLDAKKAEFDA
jgi:hypothetical protein